MKIIEFLTGLSKKLGKVKSWRLPWKSKAPALPERSVDEERLDVKPGLEEKNAEEKIEVVESREEKNEVMEVEPMLEEAPSQPTRRLDPVQEAEPPGRRKALLIGIQSCQDQSAEATQDSPVEPFVPSLTSASPPSTAPGAAFTTPAGHATPSFVALSSLTLATTRAKTKFMQKLSVKSRRPPSTSSRPSSSALPPPAGTATESCVAAVLAQAGLSNASSALPVLGSAAPASPAAPATPQTGGVTPTPSADVPIEPGESLALQQHGSSTEKLTKEQEKGKGKEREKEKRNKSKSKKNKSKSKKNKKRDHQHEQSTSSAKSNALRGCHRDVEDMEKMLVDWYGYSPSDITSMTDSSVNVGSALLPTRDNIIKQISELVEGAAPGDRFFFFFAGHSTQEKTDSPDEEDGMDELIVTYDDKCIRDDELKQLLVDPLPPGVKLTAVFDSCHSASLLDLKHFRCNRVWVPWINKGKRRSLSLFQRVVRKAAVPLYPLRTSSWCTSPRRKQRMEAASAKHITNDNAQTLEEIKKIEAKESENAQERACELQSESVGNVPEGAHRIKENPNTATTNAIAGAGKENVTPKRRRLPPMKRAKILPVYEGSRESSPDRVAVGRGSGSSEVAASSSGAAARPISILASGTTTTAKAARARAPSSEATAASAAVAAKRPEIKFPPIRTTSSHSGGTSTRPVTPVQNMNAASVTFPSQTWTPQSSRRGSIVGQQGSRRGSVHVQQGMNQVLDAFERQGKRQKGDTQLTDRTDMTNKTDQTDESYLASNISHGSGGPWVLYSEPEDMGSSGEEEDNEEEQGKGAQSQARMTPFLVATASLPIGVSPTTATIPGHTTSPAPAASRSTTLLARATSLLKAKPGDGGKEKKNKRYPRRVLSPEERFCNGRCMKKYKEENVDHKETLPFVISLSAAKDGQRALEDGSGASMTRHLVKILEKERAPSLGRLLELISHELHAAYLDIHSTAREYRKDAREKNNKRLLKGKAMKEVADVEMNNFQDPQISSLWPLDMKNELWDP